MEPAEYFGKPLQSVKATALFLDMNLGGAYAAVRKGEIPSIRIGRKIMIPTGKMSSMLGFETSGGGVSDDIH